MTTITKETIIAKLVAKLGDSTRGSKIVFSERMMEQMNEIITIIIDCSEMDVINPNVEALAAADVFADIWDNDFMTGRVEDNVLQPAYAQDHQWTKANIREAITEPTDTYLTSALLFEAVKKLGHFYR